MKGALGYVDFMRAGRIVAGDDAERYRLPDPLAVIDSREVLPGSIFVALPGERTDGHRFVAGAFDAGASWAVVSREWFEMQGEGVLSGDRRLLVADDPVLALQTLASAYRDRFDIPVIGIGGSNGKTTTKEMTAAVLSQAFSVTMSQGNRNNHLGVPLTLLQMRRDTGVAVVEMGINHPGEMELLASIAKPTHALLTNIGHEHLEFFGGLEGVAYAETALFRDLDARSGTVFVNCDDPWLSDAGESLFSTVRYGTGSGTGLDWWAADPSTDRVGRLSFTLCAPQIRQPVSTGFVGRHNLHNALAAAAVGGHFGIRPSAVAEALRELKPERGWKRMELQESGGVVVLNDTYNANPDSVRFALDTLAGLRCEGRKIAVLGDMLELGASAEEEHERIGGYAGKLDIDGICSFGDLAKRCCSAVGARCLGHFDRLDRLEEFLSGYIRPGDAVLFKASRGMRLERAAESLVRHNTQS